MQQIPELATVSMFNSAQEHQQQQNPIDAEWSSPGSSNEQFKLNRYSSASLDSGRGSDSIKVYLIHDIVILANLI